MTGITINHFVKAWGTTRAVDDVSFTAHEGTLTVLLGPSGCGKSTILRMIAGLETVDAGEVRIGDRDVTRLDPAKRGVSMVFQSYALFPHLDVRENILFGLKVRRVDPREQESRLADAAGMVGLEKLLARKPAQLSGTIVAKQPVCLMDEPLSNLDAKLRAEMRDEIQRLQRSLNLTMVYVTHDQTEAMSMADQVVLLKDGRIVQIGTPADLYDHPSTDFAAQFLGTPPMNVLPIADLELPVGAPNGSHFMGIRPEKVRLADSGLAVEVFAVDYMGAETVLRLLHHGHTIMVRVDGRAETVAGDKLQITWNEQDVHLFDQDGNRL